MEQKNGTKNAQQSGAIRWGGRSHDNSDGFAGFHVDADEIVASSGLFR
jgi:hypothetical protein